MSNNQKPWWHNSKKHTGIFSFIVSIIIVTAVFSLLYAGANFLPQDKIKPAKPSIVGLPVKLLIPIIDVDAKIQSVGLNERGEIGIPSNFTDVAWYNAGPRPGERGNSIINGHLDTATDTNAVFIKLSELKKGDEIFVVDSEDNEIKFLVTAVEIYDNDKAPSEKIFNSNTDTANLNLITCDGVWIQNERNYDKRLVVYSVRVTP